MQYLELEPYKTIRLPILCYYDVVYPGQTCPLVLSQQLFVACEFNDDRLLFALLFEKCVSDDGKYMYGVICKIEEKSDVTATVNEVCIKSRAYQRVYAKMSE